MRTSALLVCCAALLVGCAERWVTREQRRTLGATVENSHSYLAAKAQGGSRVFWMVEETNSGLTQIYVGGDMGTHTSRIVTLRVTQDGRVEKHTYDAAGEDSWVPDD